MDAGNSSEACRAFYPARAKYHREEVFLAEKGKKTQHLLDNNRFKARERSKLGPPSPVRKNSQIPLASEVIDHRGTTKAGFG
jgi:hypothetical protein